MHAPQGGTETDAQCQTHEKNWNPWLYTIGIAAGVVGVYVYTCHLRQQKPVVDNTSAVAVSVPSE